MAIEPVFPTYDALSYVQGGEHF